ncbi:hypothetical protein [Thermobacillus sp.]|uniref:hypothetical protein n=1 Tax=Thermobacillus sp. TaxID=2108467 RepID=UPI0025798CE3|nr:hypothetical protein [Thermobacillus sp.]
MAVLLLTETTEGFYWPYNPGVGVWKVKKGRAASGPYHMYGTVEPHLFDRLQT